MAHEFDSTRPIGGLNFEDEVRAVPEGDYLHASNIRNSITAANKGKTLTNVLGNLQITQYNCPYNGGTFPTGTNRCIGAVEDIVNNGAIYMVWNSQGKHGIYRYYRDLTDPNNPYGVVEQVMQYDFGWDRTTRITSLNIVYGDPTASGMGDLLYWCDPVPKKINLTKGNICRKYKTWDVVLPLGFEGQAFFFQVVVKNFLTNGNVASINVTVAANLTIAEMFTSIASQINAGLGTYLTAEACDCSMTITEDAVNGYNILFTDPNFYVIPGNWYGTSLIDRFWDRCKWQPMQAPQVEYGKDSSFEPNYVVGKVFQFRLEYVYDDNESSALGVWSQIAINNLGCDGTNNTEYNYIDVNFNDPLLLDTETLVLLKKVRLIARELNTGNDRAVIELEPCEFLDYANSATYSHYKFYNNVDTLPIDAVLAAKLFDDVPLESGAEILTNNRMVEGNCLTGYDAPECAGAKFKVDVADTTTPKLWKITGKIRILTWGLGDSETNPNDGAPLQYVQRNFYNAFPNYFKYPFWQHSDPNVNYVLRRGGIFHDTSRSPDDPGGNFPFYGGGGFGTGAGGDFGIRAGMETYYDQRIPEGGFPVYAANTPYFTISKQIDIGLSTDGVGALDTSTSDKIDAIGNYLYCNGGSCGDLYSTFELEVPDGVYVIRLASHWCSFGDKLEKGFAYDLYGNTYPQTSTNVWAVVDGNLNYLKQKEITVTVSGGNVYAGDFIVADLAPPFDADFEAPFGANGKNYMAWQPICGYLVNDANGRDINDANFAGVPVEKSVVSYSDNRYLSDGFFTPLQVPTIDITILGPKSNSENFYFDTTWNESCITDHNGYWFGIGGAVPQPAALTAFLGSSSVGVSLADCKNNNYAVISAYQADVGGVNGVVKVIDRDTLLYVGSVSDYYSKNLSPINYSGDSNYPALIHGFIATSTQSRLTSLTTIEGSIVDSNGNPVSQVNVVFEKGSYETTGENGLYSILAWADMLTPNLGVFISSFDLISSSYDRIVDRLIINGSTFCLPTYPSGQIISPITISEYGQTPPQYNINYPFLVGEFVVDELNNPNQKAHKRGGKYIYGLRYYDQSGRLCSVVSAFEMYLPFITEDLNNLCVQNNYYDPSQYPVNTYKHGKPTISWYLDNGYNPPEWAAYYQWMRTKNSIYGRYLQWVANNVTYLSAVETDNNPEIATSFQNSNAVAIKIGLSNIVDYSSTNPTSQIGYSFEQGDRLRIIANNSSVYVNGIEDYEIVNYDETTQSIVIKNENGFNEIKAGSFIEIFNAKTVSDNEQQVFYEVGEVYECTNPNNPNNQHSVTSGTFTNGDTYWRGRLIPVNDDNTNFSATYPVIVEDASISDFYSSQAQDIGRIGIIDPNFKQIRRPMLLKASNQYIPSTATNGLSSFEALNEKELDRANGAIQRLVQINQYVVAISNVRETSNYIQVVTFQQATQGQGVLAVADQFFGTAYPHSKTLGTDLPASVFINDGQIFGYHSKRSDVWLYRGDGEMAISDVKMKPYFQELGNSGVSDAVGIYDRFHEEYILTVWKNYNELTTVSAVSQIGSGYFVTFEITNETLPLVNELVTYQYLLNGVWTEATGLVLSVEGTSVTIVTAPTFPIRLAGQLSVTYSVPETVSWFNGNEATDKNRWITFYSFTPEAYCQLGSDILSFKDGKVWIHGKNQTRNNFYGQQYITEITPVFNDKPEYLKVWNSCILMQFQDNNGNDWSAPVIQNNNGQLSRLKKGAWVKKGEHWYCAFKRDLNDLAVAQNLRISQGRALRSTSLTVELNNDYTGEVTLYGWLANWTNSERTSK